ncbi:hypothetical protein [Alicyclobacillus ferrooxydans]|uniref:Uncharacterized protein n=1 Tax=Alicyclobacillus ferrooxydans TaxID=471514 RepID=A0A0P9EJL4_9BACL|nr:hypothetical protein [Alicyclobacillus ferrooxydans]KPV43177.1 hypothetical protein AN477_13895 [Alicyclobacillus ferrooxydans]
MNAPSFKFPSNFPPDCPPPDAHLSDGLVVFRAVANDPPKRKDFFPLRAGFVTPTCDDFGTSVNTDINDLVEKRKQIPGLRKRYPFIAKGRISICSGLIKEAPTNNDESHVNWWIKENFDPSSFFNAE